MEHKERKKVVTESINVFEKKVNLLSYKQIIPSLIPIYSISYYHLKQLLPPCGISLKDCWKSLPKEVRKNLFQMLKRTLLLSKEDQDRGLNRIFINIQLINSYKSQRQRFGYPSRGQKSLQASSSKHLKLKIQQLIKQERIQHNDALLKIKD